MFIIEDFIASSLEKPFCIALQYFLEKLFEILFWSKLTLGSDLSKATAISGFNRLIIKKNKTKNRLNNSYKSMLIDNIVVIISCFFNLIF